MPQLRVQRILQRAGLASRREAETWIAAGRVTVDGRTCELGESVDPAAQKVALDGREVKIPEQDNAYVALYKPRGYTTSLKDRHAEHLISELIPPRFGRLFPVGRLDRDSEGLLLLTNDGDLANALMHPKHGVKKVYEVWVEGVPKRNHLERMRHGIELEDGTAKPDEVDIIKRKDGQALLRVVLHEGRKREIRRIFDSIGHPVQQLVRTRYGNISVIGLEPGKCRPLTNREVKELKSLVNPTPERSEHEKRSKPRQTEHRRAQHSSGEGVSSARPRNSVGHTRGGAGRPHR